jgi:hypothetical protein
VRPVQGDTSLVGKSSKTARQLSSLQHDDLLGIVESALDVGVGEGTKGRDGGRNDGSPLLVGEVPQARPGLGLDAVSDLRWGLGSLGGGGGPLVDECEAGRSGSVQDLAFVVIEVRKVLTGFGWGRPGAVMPVVGSADARAH